MTNQLNPNILLTMSLSVTEAGADRAHWPGEDACVTARMELVDGVPSDEAIEATLQALKENAEAVFEDTTFRPMTREELQADLRHDREEEAKND